MRRILLSVALLGIMAAPALPVEHSRPLKAIYIGSVVSGVDEAQFRITLNDELIKAGFEVTETSDRADAILSGKVSGWSEWAGDFSAQLSGHDGKALWQGTLRRSIRTHKTACEERDTATLLAQSLVKKISKAKVRAGVVE